MLVVQLGRAFHTRSAASMLSWGQHRTRGKRWANEGSKQCWGQFLYDDDCTCMHAFHDCTCMHAFHDCTCRHASIRSGLNSKWSTAIYSGPCQRRPIAASYRRPLSQTPLQRRRGVVFLLSWPSKLCQQQSLCMTFCSRDVSLSSASRFKRSSIIVPNTITCMQKRRGSAN